jgi:hypothetical protein
MASTLAQYYAEKGQALPSVAQRAQLYGQYGLGDPSSYRGTAEQNTALLRYLQGQGGGGGGSVSSGGGGFDPTAAYQPVIQRLQQEVSNLGQVYQPQITQLQSEIPKIQQRYQALLKNLNETVTQQLKESLGQYSAQAAAAGVAPALGTPEMAAQENIKGQAQQTLSQQQQLYAAQQAQEEQGVRSQIADILARQQASRENLLAQIAQAQAAAAQTAAQYRLAQEQAAAEQARFQQQLEESRRQFNISQSSGGGGGSSAGKSKSPKQQLQEDISIGIQNIIDAGRPQWATEHLIDQLANLYPEFTKTDIATAVYKYRKPLEKRYKF